MIADALGVKRSLAKEDLRPGDKVEGVRAIGGERVLFSGDGAKDSLAVDESICSGAAVVDRGVFEERVDFYFVGRSLGFLGELFRIGGRRSSAVRSAFVFAVVYNLVAAGICLAGGMNLLIAAILMPLSSIITTAIVAGVMQSR
ncbi:MAG: hypothetical protein P8J87_06955 [Verrucomicrobiales bacterium]|nr:hypothetical protein [Verrucomicrobiales bacterium]